MRIKPAPGLKIRDPITKLHISDGHKVSETDLYWARRLSDGDVVDMDAKPAAPEKRAADSPSVSEGTK